MSIPIGYGGTYAVDATKAQSKDYMNNLMSKIVKAGEGKEIADLERRLAITIQPQITLEQERQPAFFMKEDKQHLVELYTFTKVKVEYALKN